jgi:hypothetical protein
VPPPRSPGARPQPTDRAAAVRRPAPSELRRAVQERRGKARAHRRSVRTFAHGGPAPKFRPPHTHVSGPVRRAENGGAEPLSASGASGIVPGVRFRNRGTEEADDECTHRAGNADVPDLSRPAFHQRPPGRALLPWGGQPPVVTPRQAPPGRIRPPLSPAPSTNMGAAYPCPDPSADGSLCPCSTQRPPGGPGPTRGTTGGPRGCVRTS